MKVYTFYDSSTSAHPDQAEFIRLWALSWSRRGFQPRLLTARHAQRSKFYRVELSTPALLPWLALHAVRGSGWLVSQHIINFSLPPKRTRNGFKTLAFDTFCVSRAGVAKYLSEQGYRRVRTQWAELPEGLDRFTNASDVLTCGRPL